MTALSLKNPSLLKEIICRRRLGLSSLAMMMILIIPIPQTMRRRRKAFRQ
jgi:hypothetical protein